MPFGRNNYILMLAGIAVIILGFIIMTTDTEPYGFGFRGITLGPILVMSGFIFELYAITREPKIKG
ncbi:hypothetical protein MNBD_BACTEROID06-1617 [hydrothermal vent metagenome]|uniref:DUF3098 domain-containing protein n=1 Tax=hydrothermal vent metagenome TaxID=652676 RepID=A0A3B0VA94_9ZZZZ